MLRRWPAKQKAQAAKRIAVVAVVAVLLAIGAGAAGLLAWLKVGEAQGQRTIAENQTQMARRGAYNVQLARVQDLWRHQPAQALRLLNDPTQCPIELREFTWKFFYRLCKRERATFLGHTWEVPSVAFAPDGRTLASASTDKTIKLWDAETGQERATLQGHTDWVSSVAFAPDGRTLASASSDETIKLWDAEIDQKRDDTRATNL